MLSIFSIKQRFLALVSPITLVLKQEQVFLITLSFINSGAKIIKAPITMRNTHTGSFAF